MDLARSTNFNAVNKLLTMINQEASQAASCNLQSGQVHLEDTFRDLLNCLHGTHLVNANSISRNYPGIDLIDEASLICVQVTADTSAKKMNDTLKRPVMELLSKKGFTLKFCYVGEQNNNVKRRRPKNPYGIKFDASSDSILTTDILSAFNHLDLTRQEEIIALLRRETDEGYVIDASMMRELLNRAIRQLGPRYTPTANVETPDMLRLSALADDGLLKKALLDKTPSIISSINELACIDVDGSDEALLNEAVEFLSPLVNILDETPDDNTSRPEFESWALRLSNALNNCSQYPTAWYEKVKPGTKLATAIGIILHHVRGVSNICQSHGVELLSNKRVLIYGEAGIGKSHLLADLCEKELKRKNAAILVLGGQFNRNDSSEESIPDILGLPGSLNDLLAEMQRYADSRGGVAILAVDALNEGVGRVIWRTALLSLLDKVSRYPSIRLVLSTRTTYLNEVLPDSLAGDEIEIIECEGFGEFSSVALETLCDYFGIAHPTTPLIGMEFSNPLYLKLLCQHLSDSGGRFTTHVGMGDLVAALLSDINNKLADPLIIGYDRNVPLVTWAVRAIVRSKRFSYGSIDYESAAAAVVGTVRDYVTPPGSYLESLVSEGLFNVVDGWRGKHLEFAYELVGNYIVAAIIVDKAKELQRAGAFDSSAEALSHLLADDYEWVTGDQGALAALSTICPTECGCELFDLSLGRDGSFSPAKEAFIEGLAWRSNIKVTPEMDSFIRDEVLTHNYSMRSFFSMSFQLATRRSGINPKYYRDLLLTMSMPTRDHTWSSTIARSTKAESFINWVWEHESELDEQHAENIAILLTLCLATTNVTLRRKTIKALTLILIGRPDTAERLWNNFHNIDDDYILEGICGALYGSAVNSIKPNSWTTVAKRVTSTMLSGSNAYPNAIVRDYAVLLSDLILKQRPNSLRPANPFASPWKSDWYDSLPSNEEIDALLGACKEKYGENSDEASAVWWLIHSMTTEYGRGTCAYGDFGRYILGHKISAWANQFESDQLLSNALVHHILTKWYKPDLHAAYDMEVKRSRSYGRYKGCERIGKKYQKIAMNRLLARLIDNFPPYTIEPLYREGFEEYNSSRCSLFEELVSSDDYLAISEAIGDDSDWVVGEKREPLSAGEAGCELLSLRSHDPSFPWKWSTLASPFSLTETFPNLIVTDNNPDDWCKSNTELPLLDKLRVRHLDCRRFYTLAAYLKWQVMKDGKRCRESIWLSGALLVSKDDVDIVFGHYFGHSESLSFSDIRFGELFDGWGFKLLNSLHQSERFELEKKVKEASYLYDWPIDMEELQDEAPSVLLPCAALVDHFKLIRHGALEWKDSSGRIVSHCLIDQNTGSHALLFDADILDAFLETTGQALLWKDYFEKQTARHIYRKWTNIKYEGSHFLLKDSGEPYYGETAQIHWSKEDSWFDA